MRAGCETACYSSAEEAHAGYNSAEKSIAAAHRPLRLSEDSYAAAWERVVSLLPGLLADRAGGSPLAGMCMPDAAPRVFKALLDWTASWLCLLASQRPTTDGYCSVAVAPCWYHQLLREDIGASSPRWSRRLH